MSWKQHKQLETTTLRRVRANSPAQRKNAVGLDKTAEKEVVFAVVINLLKMYSGSILPLLRFTVDYGNILR